MKLLVISTVATLAASLLASPALARHDKSDATTRTEKKVHQLRHQISRNREVTWRWEDKARMSRTPTSYLERRVVGTRFLHWMVRWWHRKAYAAMHTYHHQGSTAVGGVPAWFVTQALCVHSHEGSWTDTGDPYWGGMQFMLSTWAAAGGSGLPSSASPSEQIYRAYVIYRKDGGSWREWPNTAHMCGLY